MRQASTDSIASRSENCLKDVCAFPDVAVPSKYVSRMDTPSSFSGVETARLGCGTENKRAAPGDDVDTLEPR